MKANTHTPADIFGNLIRYVVPLYQRPYVWDKESQWQPLWDDVSALAGRVLETPAVYGAPDVVPHFLGAIVIDHLPGPVTHIQARSVIDGQQRLTTLQLLLDAAQAVTAKHGRAIDAEALRAVVENNVALATEPDHVFKVWPTDRDQDAYRAAMRDNLKPSGELANARIAQCHAFFESAVREWARVEDAPVEAVERLAALTVTLRDKLRVVVIDLEPGDNAQVIFETLNHRGAPLLAADLVKNLLFQVANAQGLDVDHLYKSYWRELDGDYWRQMVAQGRLFRPRADVFMHRWLVMKLQRDVPTDRVFTEFRDHVVNSPGVDIAAVFEQIATDAAVHRSWESLPETSVPGRFYYRVLQALDTQVVAPVFLWLTRHDETQMPHAERDRALGAIESWLVRRALVRATSKDYNNAMIDLLKALERDGPDSAGTSVERFLAGQSAESRYWPDDARLQTALAGDRLYKTMTRPRLRMVLEALEDDARGPLGEGQSAPRGLTIEHVMPVAWREHWGADLQGDEVAGLRRDDIVHTIGNLTLVNGKLNPTLSNRPWTDSEAVQRGLGTKGKRDYLLQHSQLKLNAALVYEHPDVWSEDDIRARTVAAVGRLTSIWPCPEDAEQSQSTASVAPPASETEASQGDLLTWGSDEESVEAAGKMWLSMSSAARRLFQTLIELAPLHVAAPDLAARLELDSGTLGVAGLLGRPGVIAAELGRPLPISSKDGEPSAYWMEADVAAAFEAAAQMASSETFVQAQISAEGAPRAGRRSGRRSSGSVPRHIVEVFAAMAAGSELTVREVAAAVSSEYEADEISQGAISAALNANSVPGIEWVPDSSPRRIRRTKAAHDG